MTICILVACEIFKNTQNLIAYVINLCLKEFNGLSKGKEELGMLSRLMSMGDELYD